MAKYFCGQDTAGEERFRAITSSYYRGTQGILLGWSYNHKEILASVAPNSLYAVVAVYDVTDRDSYEAIPWWFAERSKYVPESTIKIMVGNKADKVGL